jgi:hypothetical protein
MGERRPGTMHLVGCDLLALPRSADHDTQTGPASDDISGAGGTKGRVVDRLLPVGAEIFDLVAQCLYVGQSAHPIRVDQHLILGKGPNSQDFSCRSTRWMISDGGTCSPAASSHSVLMVGELRPRR